MEPQSGELDFLYATDTTFTITLSNASGVLVNYSGLLYLTVKKELDDSDSNAVLQIPLNFTTDNNGQTTLSLTSAQTSLPIAAYWYDITFIVNSKTQRSYPGIFKIYNSVMQGTV